MGWTDRRFCSRQVASLANLSTFPCSPCQFYQRALFPSTRQLQPPRRNHQPDNALRVLNLTAVDQLDRLQKSRPLDCDLFVRIALDAALDEPSREEDVDELRAI